MSILLGVSVLYLKIPLGGVADDTIVAWQEPSRMNDVENPYSQALLNESSATDKTTHPDKTHHQHAVQQIKQCLLLHDRSLPAIKQFDRSVHGSTTQARVSAQDQTAQNVLSLPNEDQQCRCRTSPQEDPRPSDLPLGVCNSTILTKPLLRRILNPT